MTTTTTERYTCPPDHGHGQKNTCRTKHGCRCDDCRLAHREYSRTVRRAKAYGRYESNLIPAVGAQRRLQALVRQGWSQKRLGVHLGWAQQRVNQVLACQRVTKDVHQQIDRLFRDLWDKEPPRTTKWELAAYHRAIRFAEQRRWPRPLDWDDIDHDAGPAAVERANDDLDESNVDLAVTGVTVPLTPAEKRAAVAALHPQGLNDQEIAARIGCSDRTVLRIRKHQLGLPHNDTLHNARTAA
ncbi:helix-turn-helix domain-containing protein [Curtobacterium sp. MCBA15_004]|uniref:helix-turn-helix domain-containing protein n=1 Tax=Curtobacterium sp. MCBA15_004 TaxID=1898733 RepID=UPI0008DC6F23|nr:helix-turn-helix domain-containing protein [Curtobacterium sp. MCBA15_004]WIA96439.1 helix-turn-helix domain-containing protein [Curtobacterium sp. MCBA15_004]